jgi:hypothetical protein
MFLLLLSCSGSPEPEPETPAPVAVDAADPVADTLTALCRVDAMGEALAPDPGELVEVAMEPTGVDIGLAVRVTSVWTEIEGEQVYPEDLEKAVEMYADTWRTDNPDAPEDARPVANFFVSREVLPEDLAPILKAIGARYDARFVVRTPEKSPQPANWTVYESVRTEMERGDGPAAVARSIKEATASCPEVATVLDQASVRRDCSHLQKELPGALSTCGNKVDPEVILTLLHVSLLPPVDEPLLAGFEVPLSCEDDAVHVQLRGPWDTGYSLARDQAGKRTCFTE